MPPSLSFENDAYLEDLQDRGQALWVASLSDGSRVFQDDGRPGVEGPAWLRLASYLSATGLAIASLRLKFRTEWLACVPDDAPAYFFSRGVGAMLGGPCTQFYSLGTAQGDKLKVVRVAVPELQILAEEERDVPPPEDGRVIFNPIRG